MKELKDGMRVQDDSLSMLIFIVQNMLDYAQIKAGKFRPNIALFDVKQSVEMVMNI